MTVDLPTQAEYERQRQIRQRKIDEDIEDVKRRQTEEQKTAEWNEQRQSTLTRRNVEANERSELLNAKTGPERIRARQRIEDRQRAENERIEMANQGKRPSTEHRLITPQNVKETFRDSVKKTPSALDRLVTHTFGSTAERMSTPASRKKTTSQFNFEMRQMSKVTNRRKIIPGQVKQISIVHKEDTMANPNFNQQLFARQQIDNEYREHQARMTQAQLEIQRQRQELEQMRMAQVQGQYESPEVRAIAGRSRVMPHNVGIHGQPRPMQPNYFGLLMGFNPVPKKSVVSPLDRLNAWLF